METTIAPLDLLDKKLMYELDLNARLSASKLAKKLRKSKETVNFRLNRLLKEGCINYFYTVCNTSKLGYYYYKIYAKFKNLTPEKEKELFAYIQKQPHLSYLASVEGVYDAVFLIMVKSPGDMKSFLDPFMETYGDYVQEKEIVAFLETHRLNCQFLYAGEEHRDTYHAGIIENYALDETDKKILSQLSVNARMPVMKMAKALRIDHKAIAYRMKKLEKSNVIMRYVTSPNFEKLGLQFYQMNIALNDPRAKKSIIDFFAATKSCLFAIELLGKYDLLVELHLPSHKELHALMDSFKARFVGRYNYYDILTITKEYLMVWNPF
ncbi:Lrp/AsnC family transcriptional regulator [Candidatus Woesearchaeota archaeon]|nr:Lrp/AsnC family transcriptional regulator [Candidatus Woesearchaeota archaeon]